MPFGIVVFINMADGMGDGFVYAIRKNGDAEVVIDLLRKLPGTFTDFQKKVMTIYSFV
jgi:hypothetical protein